MTASPSIADLGERALIARLHDRLPPLPDAVRVGIGDDAAVLVKERGHDTVVTTDSLVEGVHFRRDWSSLRTVGHKALAVNLSDLAAMGALPRAALLSLALPPALSVEDFDLLIDGFVTLARKTGTTLVGGNLAASPGPMVIDVTAIGAVRPRRILRRAGARPGHRLFVTGTVGAAGAAVSMLSDGLGRGGVPEELLERLEQPNARLRMGEMVAKTAAASAAIDLSDGLGDAARRLADAAGLGVIIDAAAIPMSAPTREWWLSRHEDPCARVLASGEDYELAFAVPLRRRSRFLAAGRRCADLRVTDVGEFTRKPGCWVRAQDGKLEPLPDSFDHF